MTWESFYLVCFLVGFLMSLVSFLVQSVHLHGDVPHLGAHGGDGVAAGHGDAGGAHTHAGSGLEQEISKFNAMTLTAFLAWFGGTGYLLARYAGLWAWLALALAAVGGIAGAAIVFWGLGKLLAREHNLDPADYDMVGVLGHVSSRLRPGGVGEMVFSQEGVRRAVPIRSEDGRAIERGIEVVVTRYERGIAYVRRWDEVSGLDGLAAGSSGDTEPRA